MTLQKGWVIERIRRQHIRDRFHSGERSLDEFLHRYARQNEERDVSRTFVATEPGQLVVLGYYSLRAGSVSASSLPESARRRLPAYPVPVVHLGRLAVDTSARGRRLGEALLVHALRKAEHVSREVAAYAVEVMAIDDAARAFYRHYGFQELLDDRLHLYLPMKVIRKLVE